MGNVYAVRVGPRREYHCGTHRENIEWRRGTFRVGLSCECEKVSSFDRGEFGGAFCGNADWHGPSCVGVN